MSNPTDTQQLAFWRGDFGAGYRDRNAVSDDALRTRVALWSSIWRGFVGHPPQSLLEVGSNIGLNLRALRAVTGADMYALEPNAQAREVLVGDGVVAADRALDGMAAAIPLADGAVDLAFTSGVLIHIHPDHLEASIREIYRVAARYIVCIEYFNDKPQTIPYRGHDDRLFKRDFGGLYMDTFPDLKLIDYGFAWKRVTGLDNLTWWAFEKPAD